MSLTRFALIFGLIYLLVGIAGFIPPLLQAPAPDDPGLVMETLHGRLFGLFRST